MSTINDYIVVLENVVPLELCALVIAEYKDSDEWNATVTGGGLNKSMRNCDEIGISYSGCIAKNQEIRQQIDDQLYEATKVAIHKYKEKFPLCLIEQDSGYGLLRYKEGEFYKEHTDSFKQQPRAVSCSFALNDDYEGGEWGFFGREIVIKPPVGAAVMFPSNFMYPHEIMPVTKGTRYSIITWFI